MKFLILDRIPSTKCPVIEKVEKKLLKFEGGGILNSYYVN